MKWGIFGGTFDPVHTGHLRCAEEVRESFGLDKVLFIPARHPPHKDFATLSPIEHRREMVRLAVAGNPFFDLSDVEILRGGTSYSIDTVEHFFSLYPQGMEMFFILGQDAFHLIKTWKDWERLLSLCHFVVMTRPGYRPESLSEILPPDLAGRFTRDPHRAGFAGPAGRMVFFRQVSLLDISASDIRKRIEEGKSVRYLLPDQVISYIHMQGCYRT